MKLAAAGHRTALLTLTRGDVGNWFERVVGSWTPTDLAAERAREWRAAADVIGFTSATLLEWPDGGLARADLELITADVVRFIRDERPDVICTFGPEGAGSEHDDHRMASYLAVRSFFRAAQPDLHPDAGPPHTTTRLFFNAAPFDPEQPVVAMSPTHAVDIGEFVERKKRAFECHRTQSKDRELFYDVLARRKGYEYFHLALDLAAPAASRDDLLA
jgi:LmbE family N-acetylglucosaminyl deacetylase